MPLTPTQLPTSPPIWRSRTRCLRAGSASAAGLCSPRDDAGLLLVVDGQERWGHLLGFRHLTFYANGPVAWVEVFVRRQRPWPRRRPGPNELF